MYGGYSISTQLIRPIISKIPGLTPTERNMPSSAKQNNPQLWGKHDPKLNRPLKLRWECVSAMRGEKFFQSWTDHAMITAFPDNISNSKSYPRNVIQIINLFLFCGTSDVKQIFEASSTLFLPKLRPWLLKWKLGVGTKRGCWNTEDEDEDIDHDGHGQDLCDDEDADDSTLSMHLFNLEKEFNKNRLWFFGPTSQIGVFPIQCGYLSWHSSKLDLYKYGQYGYLR